MVIVIVDSGSSQKLFGPFIDKSTAQKWAHANEYELYSVVAVEEPNFTFGILKTDLEYATAYLAPSE